jgi:hypothetical protein
MNKISWLFERGVYEDGNPQFMAKRVRQLGLPCAELAYVCTDDDELRPDGPTPYADDEPVIVYGSMNLLKWLRKKGQWPRLAWYDFERLRCCSYYAHWGQFLLQRNYAFLPLAEVRRRRDWVFATFGRSDAVFIRPDDNAKSFSGGKVPGDGFEQWYELANFYEPGPDCLAVVSSPESVHVEWRFVMGRRAVVTGSQYRCEGQEALAPEYPREAAEFANLVASSSDFEPHPMYTMDICQTDAGFRLVEIGPVNGSSLYRCDVEKVVEAATEIASAEQ